MTDKAFRQRIQNSNLRDIQKTELENYFAPIYYCVIEETPSGELFSRRVRWGFYGRNAKRDAERYYNERDNVIQIIEKSMVTGAEKIIKSRSEADMMFSSYAYTV